MVVTTQKLRRYVLLVERAGDYGNRHVWISAIMSEPRMTYSFARVSHGNPCYCERVPEDLSTTGQKATKLYVTINKDDHGDPFEIFVRFDDPAYYELTNVISRLISMALREGVALSTLAKELQEIHSPNTCHVIPGTSTLSPSLTARIGAVLEKYLNQALI